MTYTLEEIKSTVDNITIKPKLKKDNFFDIGTRGFYENPFTEILAHIISKESNYLRRQFFLKSFLESLTFLGTDTIIGFLDEANIQTQYTTINGKYIDLIISNSTTILVFENKIEHWLANPLLDYENDINSRFPELEKHFIVLSYNKVLTPTIWKNIIIQDSFQAIKQDLPKDFKNKWDFFVADFLNHYIPKNNKNMDNIEFEFYSTNFAKIIEGDKNVNQFILETVEKIKFELPTDTIKRIKIEQNWGGGRAARLFIGDTEDNVTIEFKIEGKFSIRIYYYQNPKEFIVPLREFVGGENYNVGKEGSVTSFALLPNKEYSLINDFLKEAILQVSKMKQYYS